MKMKQTEYGAFSIKNLNEREEILGE